MNAESSKYITPEIEKRQHRRAKLVAQIRCEALGREEVLVTRDVSIGGLFITAKKPFPVECEVAVSFGLRTGDPVISTQGRVVYSISGVGMGVQFVALNEEHLRALEKFVDEAE